MGVITKIPTFHFELGVEGGHARGEAHNLRTMSGRAITQIPFGRFVKRTGYDTANRISLVSALATGDDANDVFAVSMVANHETTLDRGTITSPGGFPAYELGEECTLAKQGTFWMVTTTATTVGDQVYAIITATNADEIGRVRSSANASAVALPLAQFQFYSNAAAGELVEVYFNIA